MCYKYKLLVLNYKNCMIKSLMLDRNRWWFTAGLVVLVGLAFTVLSFANAKPAAKTYYVTRTDAQNYWIKQLSVKNSKLHDTIIAAMILSKDTNKEIFVLKVNYPLSIQDRMNPGLPSPEIQYRLSTTRGNADNILSYNHKIRYFSFDHYSENDGPSLQAAQDKLSLDRQINSYYQELGVR